MKVLTQKDIKRIPVVLDAGVTGGVVAGMAVQPDTGNDDNEYILPASEAETILYLVWSGSARTDAVATGKVTLIFAGLVMVILEAGEYTAAIAAGDKLTAGTDGLVKVAATGDLVHGVCFHTDGDDRYCLWSVLGYNTDAIA